ncbi:sensor histidine kinase [Pleomorphovibrio marinus]|uniref:sensor histidine kinase n=1 Tax=Pleomorphovibrio marinus TaxID=2164132 RepID=UPI000E0B7837|nr:ATP-binding protein [Pleomorphovibrio marinus]
MEGNSFEVFVTLAASLFLMIIMSTFVVSMVLIHRQRQVKDKHKMEIMKADFEKTVLNVEKEIREDTLHYVSQELHDNVGQMLSLAKLVLNNPDPESVAEGKKIINQIIKEVRALSKSINRDYIKDVGFEDFLAEELQKIEGSGFCKTSLQVQGELPSFSDDNKKLILIRLVQECLNNAIKHAAPEHIDIILTYDKPLLSLKITDDGQGFDTQAQSAGLGLRNLKSRMTSISGDLHIRSQPEKGTSIQMSLEM